jgi:hypothetical protein
MHNTNLDRRCSSFIALAKEACHLPDFPPDAVDFILRQFRPPYRFRRIFSLRTPRPLAISSI